MVDVRLGSKYVSVQWFVIAGRKSEGMISTAGVSQGNLGLPFPLILLINTENK